MRPKAPKVAKRPLVLALSPKDELTLAAFSVYRYLTAKDLGALLEYSPKSLPHIRERLARLCGNKDHQDEGYPLYRFAMPTSRLGGQERIYVLSATGRKIVESLGIPVCWHVRPAKLRTFSHSHLLHSLTLNRTVIAFHAWVRSKPNITVESRLCYELAKQAPVHSIPMQGKMVKVAVIPDSLLLIQNMRSAQRLVVLLEVDRNTEAQSRFRAALMARLAYVQSPNFTKTYGDTFRIAYATQGQTPSASEARRKAMCIWTMDVLTHLKKQDAADFLRFTTINLPTILEDATVLLEGAAWYRPDQPTTPVPLLTDAKPTP